MFSAAFVILYAYEGTSRNRTALVMEPTVVDLFGQLCGETSVEALTC